MIHEADGSSSVWADDASVGHNSGYTHMAHEFPTLLYSAIHHDSTPERIQAPLNGYCSDTPVSRIMRYYTNVWSYQLLAPVPAALISELCVAAWPIYTCRLPRECICSPACVHSADHSSEGMIVFCRLADPSGRDGLPDHSRGDDGGGGGA